MQRGITMERLCFAMHIFALFIFMSPYSLASTSKSYFFHCDPEGSNYQVSFHPEAGGILATQRHKGLGKYSSIDQEIKVTNFSVNDEGIYYSKLGSDFKISRVDGVVFRDNQPSQHICREVSGDLVIAAQKAIQRAKTTKTEFWSMTTGMGDTDYVQLGMLATSNDICQLFEHPFFNYSQKEYRLIDRVNSDFSWDGIQAASLWIKRKFRESGVTMRRFGLMKNIHQAANKNVSTCLAQKEMREPGFYRKLTKNFLINLGYQGVECYKTEYRIEQDVDSQGNLINRKVPIGMYSCIDFNFNSGRLNDWNSSTFTLMLIWKEAHPVLINIFDEGQKVVEERSVAQLAKQQAEADRKNALQQKNARFQRSWNDYKSREKTLMEQVYNLATSGFVGGVAHEHWVEKEKCVLTNGRRSVDNRTRNMTAFRIRSEFVGSDWAVVSSDQKTRFVTFQQVAVDRLQKAWGAAFNHCPGKKTRF